MDTQMRMCFPTRLRMRCSARSANATSGIISRTRTKPSAESAAWRFCASVVRSLLAEKKRACVNVDATVIAEAPKIAPHIPADAGEIARRAGHASLARRRQSDDERRIGFPRPRRRDRRDGGRERGSQAEIDAMSDADPLLQHLLPRSSRNFSRSIRRDAR